MDTKDNLIYFNYYIIFSLSHEGYKNNMSGHASNAINLMVQEMLKYLSHWGKRFIFDVNTLCFDQERYIYWILSPKKDQDVKYNKLIFFLWEFLVSIGFYAFFFDGEHSFKEEIII